jgi:DNA repair exonuclease SbcCD ATPase subunit
MNCTLKDLYDFIHFENEKIEGIKVKTRYGKRDIKAIDITARNSEVHCVKLVSGKFIKTSPDHLLWKNEWVKVKHLKIGDYIETEHGLEEIVANDILNYKDDLYDIEVDTVHEFFANNIVSHNSTLSDVIKFGLYGKVDGKKLKELPNRFNNALYVKIEVEKNSSTHVVIERGIAPSIFKVYVNGIEYDQAGKKNVQDFLEDEILGVPYYVFNNMVSLSINDFKSFISMGVHDKRMIIDRLFGLEVLGSIKWKVKYQIKTMKEQIDLIDTEISVIERNITASVNELELLNQKIKEASEEKKTILLEKIQKLNEFIKNADENLKQIKEKNNDVEATLKEWENIINGHKTEIHICTEKIRLYENGKCPTCESDLTTEHHKFLLHEYIKRDESSRKIIEETREKIKELSERKEKIKSAYSELNNKKINASSQLYSYTNEINLLKENHAVDEQTQSLKNIINDNSNKKNEAIQRKTVDEKKANFYKIIEDIFGDKGVKVSALKRILPVLNVEIKKVLNDLNMDYRVSFNEEFDVDIQHLGFKVSAEQLSTGERKKVDFAVLIALIRLMKTKFAGLNLIYLDEIFSSIDSDGIYHILKVLHKTCRELNLNIFVINHSQLPTEIFDYKVDIIKNNGFSNLNIEKIG